MNITSKNILSILNRLDEVKKGSKKKDHPGQLKLFRPAPKGQPSTRVSTAGWTPTRQRQVVQDADDLEKYKGGK
tara:strand:- start:200 stop:421 length:222 start_codon:yes stop_codon:yes gene_type:complete